MEYLKGKKVNINVKGDRRTAIIKENGVDSKGKVRVRPEGFPFDISVQQSEIIE